MACKCYTYQMISLLMEIIPTCLEVCVHLCLVSVLLSGPSLTEMKFYRNFFPQLSFQPFSCTQDKLIEGSYCANLGELETTKHSTLYTYTLYKQVHVTLIPKVGVYATTAYNQMDNRVSRRKKIRGEDLWHVQNH